MFTASPPKPPLHDPALLRAALTADAQRSAGSHEALRAAARTRLGAALKDGRTALQAWLEAGATGMAVAGALSDLQDQLIQVLYDFTVTHVFRAQNPTDAEHLALVAVGGYGRGALAPGSDIDILFVQPYRQTPWGESVVEFMLYTLWDLGLKVGHATRSIDDCIRLSKSDFTIRTSVLEARFVWGDYRLYETLKQRFWREVAPASSGEAFVEAKLTERNVRHRNAGESRYLVEPNVKDGKGGLRDLHTLYWIGKYLYRLEDVSGLVSEGVFTPEEYRAFQEAEAFLWLVRCHLHFMTGRPEERLTFDVQLELARRLGYADGEGTRGVERFMKDYFLVAKRVGDLTRIFCAALEAQHKKEWPVVGRLLTGLARRRLDVSGFSLDSGRLNVDGIEVFQSDPVNLIRLFHLADQKGVDVHPNALRHVTRTLHLIDDRLRSDTEANRLFLETLCSRKDPERALRLMNEAGVFGRFVPAFGRIVAQMQFNMYHHYTVDEHLIRAIGNLARIERGELKDEHPVANEIIHKVLSREVLYVAVLLHDIAKGGEGDHSEEGEQIAHELCPRLGMTPDQTESVAWLVRYHLIMSDVAQKRDLSNPKTIRDFVEAVQSPERLRLLLCLTVADIRAVGPGVWNGWKGQLLRELYHAAEDMMTGGFSAAPRPQRVQHAKAELRDLVRGWPAAEIERALGRHYDAYWLSLDGQAHFAHAVQMREADARAETLSLRASSDAFRAITQVTIYTSDHPGLFSQLAGAFAMMGANILDAKVFTTTDGAALDMFWVQDGQGEPFGAGDRIERLRQSILRTLNGEVIPRQVMDAKRTRARDEAFKVEPRVLIDNNASDAHTLVEVNGRDRPGLLHDLTRALFAAGLSIHSAHIATFGERAVDVFYVRDAFGLKVTQPARIEAIRKHVTEALGDGGLRVPRRKALA
jgi:[protein-PII] uridylyltransferase